MARLVEHHTITTKPTTKKLRALVVDDHLRRARELWHGILRDGFCQQGVGVVALEALSLARNAGSAARQAMAYAVAICACERDGVPVAQFTPQQIRKRLGLAHNADKAQVAGQVMTRCVCRSFGMTEHESDACAAALACLYPEPVDIVRAAQGRQS
jgi:Holliday junction resolvasome RuvABC endonuclease subunit